MGFSRGLIIVPTYDERDNVAKAADSFLAPIAATDLLFVDDNSPDGTGELLDSLAAENPRVHVLHRSQKKGLGGAYLDGFRWGLARDYDFFVEMDADFSHNPKFLPALVDAAGAGADVVVGSRYTAGGGTVHWGLGRRLISRAGGTYARCVLGVDIRDLTSGYVCYRRRVLERLDLDSVVSNGYSFQIEMKYRSYLAGFSIREMPIVFEERRVGQSKMSKAIVAEALWMVWRLRFGELR